MTTELLPCPVEGRYIPEPMSGCWLWTGAIQSRGYGHMVHDGKYQLAHRVSYEHFCKTIPDGMTLDHGCRTRSCINPRHLREMTQKDNNLLGDGPTALNARKTVCANGHPLSGPHIRIVNRADGVRRRCTLCAAIYKRRRRARSRAA